MSRKKKKKLLNRLFLIMFLLFLVLYFKNDFYSIFNKDEIVQPEEKGGSNKDNNIKKTEVPVKNNADSINESDSSDVVDNYFAKGMSTKDYNNIVNKKTNYIKSTRDYGYLEYNFEDKINYSKIEEYYNNMNASDIVKLEKIGSSVDGRTIYGIEIGKGKKTIFIDSNIHAAEVANTLILMRFLNEMINNYELNDEYTVNLFNNYKIVAIPCINPDGYEVYNFGVESLNNKNLWIYQEKDKIDFENLKSNANGVDINRNFPSQNAALVYKKYNIINSVSLEKTTSNSKYFGGTTLGSEPETKATMYFMLKHYKNTIAYINLHSQGRVIYAGKPNLTADFNDISIAFAKKVASKTGYKVYGLSSEEVGEGNDGSATDFMAELANGLTFNSNTGRLSANKYINPTLTLKYKYSVITMETLNRYTRNPEYYKDEYYSYYINELFYNIVDTALSVR